MSDIYKSENVDKPRDEGIIVPPIQRDKKEKEEFSKESPERSKKILSAAFFAYLKNLFDSFSSKEKIEGKIIDHIQILEDLQAFKSFLQAIGNQDQANDPHFAHQLSQLWHNLLQDFKNIEILERKNLKSISTFQEFIQDIQNYPVGQDHSFGYYLSEGVGEEWLPFPYIELLAQLHKEYKTSLKTSKLNRWIEILDEIIQTIRKKVIPK